MWSLKACYDGIIALIYFRRGLTVSRFVRCKRLLGSLALTPEPLDNASLRLLTSATLKLN